jgi:hypothetical protein
VIIDLQRRLAEIGRIRIGQQVQTQNGKTRPAKLDTFRLTSPDRVRIEHAARLYGGTPKPWDAPAGKQWEIITTAQTLPVIVPPSDMAFSQHYELWSAGGCQRRCDGRTETISDGPCLCDPDRRECGIHSRLSVLLTDLPGLGVWRIDTAGYYAAVELQGAVEAISLAAGRGQMLPARLRLEQRAVKRIDADGKPVTRRFAVPVLDIEISPGQLFTGARAQLTAAPPEVEEVEPAVVDGSAPLLTPVPETVPIRPAGSIAEQMARTQQPPPTPPRANAARPVPVTGLAPRTAQQAAADEAATPPPIIDAPLPEDTVDEVSDDYLITELQLKALHAGFHDIGVTDRAERLAMTCQIIGRQITSANDLYRAEASVVIEELWRRTTEGDFNG